ncbi:MAG TPA: glycerol-3-phosphate dehydrogenase [Burkholderiaceae bacterium]|nr:glycerol-3-phosphate dehydrogenase [Burkholderiaceae bacterium]
MSNHITSGFDYDLLVVGGGINGAGIARDAAGRGLSVLLVEQDDLAAHTSSASTKLIHGGLRYLEHYEFRLVRKALAEREILLRQAPHIAWPMRFVLPHEAHLRPMWMIRAGLFLYDHLATRSWLPGSRSIDLRRHVAGMPLRDEYARGFEYSDGWVDDARLVVLNAMDAAARGAHILTRTRLTHARPCGSGWVARLESAAQSKQVHVRAIANAAGPWAQALLAGPFAQAQPRTLRLVRGSHIVVPRIFEHGYAYIFQHIDGRVVFAIPYEGAFTLIGTTDYEVRDPKQTQPSEDEITYLISAANRYFVTPLKREQVVHAFGGIRPLLDDGANAAAVTRDYALELNNDANAPLLNVFGGKITTYRRLAEEALSMLASALGCTAGAWTAHTSLPGGDLPTTHDPQQGFSAYVAALSARFPRHPPRQILRLARTYGTFAEAMLADERSNVCADVGPAELEHAFKREWARDADDFLWRRTKLGLHLTPEARIRITEWFSNAGA